MLPVENRLGILQGVEIAPQVLLAWLQEHFGLWLLPYYPKLGDPFQHSPELFLDSTGQFLQPVMLEQLRLWMFVQGEL